MADYLVKEVEDKKWLWFKNSNNYLLLENDAFLVFEKLQLLQSIQKVARWCADTFHLSDEDAFATVNTIHSITSDQRKRQVIKKKITEQKAIIPKAFYSSKNYQFNNRELSVFYGDPQIETLFHPLLAHLETTTQRKEIYKLKLFLSSKKFILVLDERQVGSWTINEEHLFKGQVFMALLNKAYSKTEKDWLGVLHASAIGYNQNCVLFLGDSGNGKSTASAIALANDFLVIADDFVPIDSSGKALVFPAAISIKKQALETLSKTFPELGLAQEYELEAMNKTVRYLPNKNIKSDSRYNVKALVFIKYNPDVEFELESIDKHQAFQYLVVDSWLSSEEENAAFFMDWVADLPAFNMQYSNNEKMLKAIQKLLHDDE